MKLVTFAALLLLSQIALVHQANAARIRLNWSAKHLSASLPRGGGRSLNVKAKTLKVCSGDVVNFHWSGEQMGLFLFDSGASHWKSCNKSNLNFVKNIRPSGDFNTKANHSGWRYYGYVTKAGKGTCEQKIKIYWDTNC